MGQEGFSDTSALLYHRHSPSALLAIEGLTDADAWAPGCGEVLHPNHPLRPHHLRTGDLAVGPARDLVLGRHLLLGNDDVRLVVRAGHDDQPALSGRCR